MNCGCGCQNNWSTPAFYTMTSGCGCGGYQTYGNNNGWCTLLLVIFIIFIICGVSKAL